MGFGFDNTSGWSFGEVDKVVFARDASWSDKEEFFLFLLVVAVSEIGVGGVSGMDLELIITKFLEEVFSLRIGGVLRVNPVGVLLVSTKEILWMLERGAAIIRVH